MEDDDDDDVRSQSPSQSNSQSPSPPPQAITVASAATPSTHSHPNGASAAGRVTVAAAPQHLLTLALPIQPHRPGSASGGGAGGREDCWSEGATSALIDAWGERYLELSRGNLRQKQWQEVADAVSSRDDYTKPPKSDVQCKNRIDTLKKKYKLEKTKVTSGASPGSSWPFFHRLDFLIGPNSKPSSSSNPPPPPLSSANISHSRAAAAVAGPMHTPFPQRNRTHPLSQQNHKKRSISSSSSKSGGMSADSSDGFPPETANGSKRRPLFPGRAPPPPPAASEEEAAGEGRIRGLKELTQAIRQFGAVYERVESSKLQQAVEMAKQRMEFARELEVQRMQFFMKTQKELSQLNS